MSLIEQIKQYRSNKSGESASSIKVRSWTVRDSRPSLSQCITNLSTGTFTPLISFTKLIPFTILILAISFFMGSEVYATASSITVSIDDSTIDLNVAPTGQGAFSKSNTTTIGVSTTNYTGYTLSIAAQEGDNPTALVNGSSSLVSIENAITESQFKALDSTAYNNQWGYLPSKYNSENNNSFLPSPSTEGDTLDITSVANTTVNEYEITLGARVDTTASLGSYSNVFLVEAVANATPYTIIFDDNVVGSMPADIASETTGTTVTLPSNVPTREGYTFIGWCSTTPTTSATTTGITTDTCSGTTYHASGSLTLDQEGGSNDYHLYAMWQELTLQTFTASMCSTYASDDQYTLKDARDGKSYTVRYINGNCWMTQNLAIEPGTHMTAGDTNITSAQYNNTGYYSLPGSGYDLKTNGASGGNCYGTYSNGTYSGGGWTNACTHLPDITDTTDTGYTSIQLGAWYNYAAATASTIATASDNTTEDTYNICPKNWSLPNQVQFNSIVGQQSSTLNALYGGSYFNGLHYGTNTGDEFGLWWLSYGESGSSRYYLRYQNGNPLDGRPSYRNDGVFVRCVRTT